MSPDPVEKRLLNGVASKKYKKTEKGRLKHLESRKRFNEKRPHYGAEWNLKKKYGITLDDYNKMFSKQKGKCAICDRHQLELGKDYAWTIIM
ncbi:hypothetical protein LCGC14_0536180 [marine sediment metagenome]|uniref:Uncharacterized protein n=1 Tax=marine sediment metagenome TaxID=412755 RepID=A0A0F9UFM3_9ZZZZ